eukprot:5247705-Prymnesium_polylepis.2
MHRLSKRAAAAGSCGMWRAHVACGMRLLEQPRRRTDIPRHRRRAMRCRDHRRPVLEARLRRHVTPAEGAKRDGCIADDRPTHRLGGGESGEAAAGGWEMADRAAARQAQWAGA